MYARGRAAPANSAPRSAGICGSLLIRARGAAAKWAGHRARFATMGSDDVMLALYRATGADLPFADPRGYHGVAMEGYFWRLTHVASRTVLVVLAGVNRDAEGVTWGTVGIAGHPG